MPGGGNSQAIYWMLTIPVHEFIPYLPPNCKYLKGQQEIGENGFHHWQVLVHFTKKTRLNSVRETFGPFHAEPTKSIAAEAYVWKDDTRVEGTQFELGNKSTKRNSPEDWDRVWVAATEGRVMDIPADIRMRSYSTINRIREDYTRPLPRNTVKARCFVGISGSGKTHRAYEESGGEVYWKDPTNKWWDGYKGETHVIIDEFRGNIDLSLLLRWLDKYPCTVEVKGGTRSLCATHFWITSNRTPLKWFPELDVASTGALLRRLDIEEMDVIFEINNDEN